MENEELIGKKIRGFEFDKINSISFANSMSYYIGEIGEIINADSVSVQVEFLDGCAWWYPFPLALSNIEKDQISEYYEIY
jgi:hypothetical protein